MYRRTRKLGPSKLLVGSALVFIFITYFRGEGWVDVEFVGPVEKGGLVQELPRITIEPKKPVNGKEKKQAKPKEKVQAQSPSTAQPQPKGKARGDIPAQYLALYRRYGGMCPGLSWGVLAGIGKVETNHGRLRLPGVRSGENFAGAGGPMQFLSGTWKRHGKGGNRYDPRDAIQAAARKLCADGASRDLRRAIFAYNHAWWYVDKVMAWRRAYEN